MGTLFKRYAFLLPLIFMTSTVLAVNSLPPAGSVAGLGGAATQTSNVEAPLSSIAGASGTSTCAQLVSMGEFTVRAGNMTSLVIADGYPFTLGQNASGPIYFNIPPACTFNITQECSLNMGASQGAGWGTLTSTATFAQATALSSITNVQYASGSSGTWLNAANGAQYAFFCDNQGGKITVPTGGSALWLGVNQEGTAGIVFTLTGHANSNP